MDLQGSGCRWTLYMNKGIHKKAMQALTSLQGAWQNHGQKTHCMVRSSTMASWATRKQGSDSSSLGLIWWERSYVCCCLSLTHPHWVDEVFLQREGEKKWQRFNLEADVMAVFVSGLRGRTRSKFKFSWRRYRNGGWQSNWEKKSQLRTSAICVNI